MGVKVSGLNHMLNKLEKLGRPDKVGPALVEAVKAGGQVVYDAVEANTPERTDRWTDASTALKPGELKENLYLINDLEGDRGTPRSIVKFHKDVRHVARWVEKGHRLIRGGTYQVNKKTGLPTAGSRGKYIKDIPGTNFFARAVEGKSSEVRDVVRSKLRDEINKIVRE